VLAGGHLGEDGTFRSVIPDAQHASMVVYVDVDALEPAIAKADPGDDLADLKPVKAVGLSTWTDEGVTRFSFKLTTN
jgi:hypothetical protein